MAGCGHSDWSLFTISRPLSLALHATMRIVIPGTYWLKAHIVFILWLPSMVLLRFGDQFHDSILGFGLEIFLYVIFALALIASLLHRINLISVEFSASDRRTKMFKYLRHGAKKEKEIWKNKFSNTYYETYLRDKE